MPSENTPRFVDANVLVYAFDKRGSPKKRVADRPRMSTQGLQELFVTPAGMHW